MAFARPGCSSLPRTFLAPRARLLLSPWKSSRGRPESYFSVASEAGQEPGLWGGVE